MGAVKSIQKYVIYRPKLLITIVLEKKRGASHQPLKLLLTLTFYAYENACDLFFKI